MYDFCDLVKIKERNNVKIHVKIYWPTFLLGKGENFIKLKNRLYESVLVLKKTKRLTQTYLDLNLCKISRREASMKLK